MNPYLIITAMVAMAGAVVGGFQLGVDHERANQIDKQELVAESVDAATAVSANAIAQLKPKYTTISNQLERQIETHTVFRDCRLDPVSLQLANQALTGGSTATSIGKLPDPDPIAK